MILIWYMRNLLLVQTSDNVEDVIDASADRIQALKEEAQMVETEVLMRYIRVFFGFVKSDKIFFTEKSFNRNSSYKA